MFSPRGQTGLETKILSLALESNYCPRLRPRATSIDPRHVLERGLAKMRVVMELVIIVSLQ